MCYAHEMCTAELSMSWVQFSVVVILSFFKWLPFAQLKIVILTKESEYSQFASHYHLRAIIYEHNALLRLATVRVSTFCNKEVYL